MAKVEKLLADYFDVEVDDITELGDNYYEVEGDEYIVATESEAEAFAKESLENLADDIGWFNFSDMLTNEIIYQEWFDTRWFEDAKEEYIDNMRDDPDDYTEDDIESVEDMDAIEWYINDFGEKELTRTVKKYNLVDEDEVTDFIINTDGLGHILAGYDGEEHDIGGGYYAYRTN
jgi:hypothetical protein